MRDPLRHVTARMRAARQPDDDGAVLVLFAIALTALIGLAALAINLGDITQVRTNTQDAADAAALAGATALASGASATAAVNTAEQAATSYFPGRTLSWNDPAEPCAAIPGSFVKSSSTACVAFYPSLGSPQVISVEIPPQPVTSLVGSGGNVDVVASSVATTVTSHPTLCFPGGDPKSSNCVTG